MSSTSLTSRLLLILVAVLPIQQARAQSEGLSGFSFLGMEPSARAAALGGAFSAVYGDDVNAMFYNPALLNEQMHRSLSVSFLNHIGDLRAGFLAYSLHSEALGSVGVGVRFLNWGELTEADASGNELGTFSASDVAFTVGLGRLYTEQLYVGVSLHSILSSVGPYKASALAVDAGVLYTAANNAFTFSASVNNLGVTLNSLGALDDELPLDFRLGITTRLQHLPLLISITGYDLHEYDAVIEDATAFDRIMQHVAFGGEFQFSEGFNLRFGYNHRRHETLKLKSRLDFAGFGFGAGIRLARVKFDYAFNSWSSLGGLHQFTLRTIL